LSSDAGAVVNRDTVLHSVGRVLDAVEALVSRVDPAQLEQPSWCGIWTVRSLLNHMTFENLAHAALADGGADMPAPDAATDYLGDDHVAAFRASTARVRAALGAPGVLRRTYGPQQAPGAFIAQMLINEQLTHGWDLARATGQSTDIAPDVAEQAIDAARMFYVDVPRSEQTFLPETQPPEDATAADRLAAFMGRMIR
jgi:uncharacterized protein (TIGR03086 family)